MLINYFVKEIILYHDEVKIYFNNPLKVSPDNSQGFSFYNNYAFLPRVSKNGTIVGENEISLKMIV